MQRAKIKKHIKTSIAHENPSMFSRVIRIARFWHHGPDPLLSPAILELRTTSHPDVPCTVGKVHLHNHSCHDRSGFILRRLFLRPKLDLTGLHLSHGHTRMYVSEINVEGFLPFTPSATRVPESLNTPDPVGRFSDRGTMRTPQGIM